ncbi:MAG TPA: hypothetical protein VG711_12835, partial [Phycisphaerales bacterium]|nr:hypothetical protein [Phycisphaerales bacterium]
DGAVTDMFKIMMIQLLADPSALEGMKQFGPGFEEVIVGLRNQTALDSLKTLIEKEPNTPSVAIFYGAAHMGDMAKKLRDQFGYEPTDKVEWLSAITVDIEHSALTPAEVRQMRIMMKQMMRQMRAQMQGN